MINIKWIIEAADMRADGWGDLLDGNGVAARCSGVVHLGHGGQILTDDAHRSFAFVRELDGVEKSDVYRSMLLARWYQFILPWSCYGHVHVDLPRGTQVSGLFDRLISAWGGRLDINLLGATGHSRWGYWINHS